MAKLKIGIGGKGIVMAIMVVAGFFAILSYMTKDEKIEAPTARNINIEENQGWLILGLGNSRHWIVKNDKDKGIGLEYSPVHRSPTTRTSWEVKTSHGKIFVHGDLVPIYKLGDFLKNYKKIYQIPANQEPIMITGKERW